MRMSYDLNDLPGEVSEPVPSCSYCGDAGHHFQNEESEFEFCECEAGAACAQAHLDGQMYDDHSEDYEGGLFEDDADALASAGMGTDEDYGCYDSGDEW